MTEAAQLGLAEGQKHRASHIRFTIEALNDTFCPRPFLGVGEVVLREARRKQLDLCHSLLRFFKGTTSVEYCARYGRFTTQHHLRKVVQNFMFVKMDDEFGDLEIASVRVMQNVYKRTWKSPNNAFWWRTDYKRIRMQESRLAEIMRLTKAGIHVAHNHVCSFGCTCDYQGCCYEPCCTTPLPRERSKEPVSHQ